MIALGYFGKAEDTWGFVGGRVDPGETFEQTLRREVQEESNMEIISFLPLGYQKAVKADGTFSYQLRYACKVRPYGPFVSDPAHGVVKEINLIDPALHKEYIHWGKIGERLVERGLELLPKL